MISLNRTVLLNVVIIMQITIGIVILLITFFAIFTHSFDVLTRDEWRMYMDYDRLSFVDQILYKQNGHAMILPNIVYAINNKFFAGVSQTMITINVLINIIVVFVFSITLYKSVKFSPQKENYNIFIVASAIIFALLIFWFAGSTKLFWAIGIHNFLTVIGVIIAMYWLGRFHMSTYSHPIFFVYVFVGLFIATFSFGVGLAAWGAIIFLSIILRFPKKYISFLLIGAIFSYILTQKILPPADSGVKMTFDPAQIFEWTQIFLSFLGSSFAQIFYFNLEVNDLRLLAISVGVIVLLISTHQTVDLYIRSRQQKVQLANIFYLGIAWFVIIAAALIALSRVNYGIDVGLAPRYSGWSVLLVTSIFGLIMLKLINSSLRPLYKKLLFVTVFFIVIAISLKPIFGSGNMISHQITLKNITTRSTLALLLKEDDVYDRDIRTMLYHNRKTLIATELFLSKNKLNIYNNPIVQYLGKEINDFHINTELCHGHFIITKATPRVFVREGYAFSNGGDNIESMIVARKGVVVGLGMSYDNNISYKYDKETRSNAFVHFTANELDGIYKLLKLNNGWIILEKRGLQQNESSEAEIFGVLETGAICRIDSTKK